MNATVDILVPVFGAEHFIERCAVSVFEQTYKNIVFYFLDDCSKDKSITILEQVVKRYPLLNVNIIRHSANEGLAASRWDLLKASSGEYILQVDADDYLDTTAVEKLMSEALRKDADIVGMDCWFEWKNQRKVYHALWSEDPKEYTRILLSGRSLPSVWRHLIKRSLYSDSGAHPEPGINVGEDYMVLPKLTSYAKRIAYISEPLQYYWQVNNASYMHQMTDKNVLSLVTACKSLSNCFISDSNYNTALNEGMWYKKADLMMHVSRRQYSMVIEIPTILPVPFKSLPIIQRLAAGLISKKRTNLLFLYSKTYCFFFMLLQKLKGR